MAMSRILSRSLLHRAALRPPSAIISHHRHRSNKSHRSQLIEVDLDPASSSSPDEVITVGVKKLEEAIHGMIVRRAAPDWLPFLPGYSYWVPPSRSSSSSAGRRHPSPEAMMEVFRKFASSSDNLLSEDENMACTSAKGWPSSSFFIDDTSPAIHPVPVMELHVKIQDSEDNADNTSNSEDEEG